MEEDKAVITPHAIMIAVAYQGHLNPFVHLAIKLASKGFTVTFVNFEHAHHQIAKSHQNCPNSTVGFDMFSEARSSGVDIRYATISDGYPYDRSENLMEYWEYMLNEFPPLADEFVGHLIEESLLSDPSLVPFIVADTVASWPGLIAKNRNMVNVSLWTEPAVIFAIHYYTDLLIENDRFLSSGNDEDYLIDYIPGVEPIRTKDLMAHLQETDLTTFLHKIFFKVFEEVKKADFVLHNTVQELESNTLSALHQLNPTYAIGPINFSTKINVSDSLLSETDCTKWLNSMPAGSVLYVSFGSLVQTDKHFIQEVANGLRLSKLNFLWVIRSEIVEKETNLLPVGFEVDVKDTGLIVPWCDQKAVLSHAAIGGFLTHCGWNSILESIWFGVPMICHPILFDQPTNRKLVVDDWKIGINLCDDYRAAVNREEVALKIKLLMNVETSDGVRNEMKKYTSILHNALGVDGSSQRNFDRFLKDLKKKLQQGHEHSRLCELIVEDKRNCLH